MFYKIREDGYDEWKTCYHSVWREDFCLGEKLYFTDCLKLLSTEMRDYDTIQVEDVNSKLYENVMTGAELKERYKKQSEEFAADILW